MTRVTKPIEIRREEFMNTAEALFLQKGYEATTINDIIHTMDVAKGTFYHYFQFKLELLEALKDRYTLSFLKTLETALNNIDSQEAKAQLSLWIRTNILTYLETYPVHDLCFGGHHHERGNRSLGLPHEVQQ